MTIGKTMPASLGAMLIVMLALGMKSVAFSDAVSLAKSDMFAAERGVVVFTRDKAGLGAKISRYFPGVRPKLDRIAVGLGTMDGERRGKGLLNQLKSGLQTWEGMFAEIRQVRAAGDPDAAVQIFIQQGVPLYHAIGKNAQMLQALETRKLAADRLAAADTKSLTRWIAFSLLGLSLAPAAGVLGVVRNTSRSLKRMAAEIEEGAEQINSAAAQVAGSSQSLAQGASGPAASLEETSASTAEITSMTQERRELQIGRAGDSHRGSPGEGGQPHPRKNGSLHATNQFLQRQDRANHQSNRRDRVPDQHSGAECGGGSGACRESRHGLRGGGR